MTAPHGGQEVVAISCWTDRACMLVDEGQTQTARFFETEDAAKTWRVDAQLTSLGLSAGVRPDAPTFFGSLGGVDGLACTSSSTCVVTDSLSTLNQTSSASSVQSDVLSVRSGRVTKHLFVHQNGD